MVSIIAILGSVFIPNSIGYTERAKEGVCKENRLELERMYETYLILEDIEHSEDVFQQYLDELDRVVCPGGGDIEYVDGEVKCGLHSGEGKDLDDESVPFL